MYMLFSTSEQYILVIRTKITKIVPANQIFVISELI